MTDDEITDLAACLEPALRDWLSDRLLDLELDPLDGVKVMRAVAERLREHMQWVDQLS